MTGPYFRPACVSRVRPHFADLLMLEASEECFDMLGRFVLNAEEWSGPLSVSRVVAEAVCGDPFASPEVVSEAAQERVAIAGEGWAVGAEGDDARGLVLVPTTVPGQKGLAEAAGARVAEEAETMRSRLERVDDDGVIVDVFPDPCRAPGPLSRQRRGRVLKATAQDQQRARIARLRQQVGLAARAHEATARRPGFRPDYRAMVTLTYKDGRTWGPEHVSDFIRAVRKWLASRDAACRYTWVAEVQKRGAIHYHVVFWLPAGTKLPKPDRQGWWPHGKTRVEAARGAVGYLMSYLKKAHDVGRLPRGARMHGCGGIEHALRRARRWLSYPAWVRARADVEDDWRRAPGGGWSNPDGLVIPSEHVRAWLGDRWGCLKVVDYGRPFPADGPFCWIDRGPRG